MFADLRDALRKLRKSPGFTVTAVITLALGIGATTAIFTLVHQVMLKSLPVVKPEELIRIGDKNRCCNWGGFTQGDDGDFSLFGWDSYKHFRANTPEFSDLAALQAGNTPLAIRRVGSQAPVDTQNGQYVSGNFFRTFGIQPWAGRVLADSDDVDGAPLVAVMSYRIWQQKYGADPSVVGSGFQINGFAFTVIGIAPPGFFGAKLSGGGMPDFWMPMTAENTVSGPGSRLRRIDENYLDLIGRVKPGTDTKALEVKLQTELHNWEGSHVSEMSPGEKALWQLQTLHLTPGGAGVADLREAYKSGLNILLIAAGCVLLVACGNLANLMLARGLKERAQISVRVALGASRTRLVRKALVESVVLALIGGLAGIVVAYSGTRLILYLAFEAGNADSYVPINAEPSGMVLLFTLGVSVLTGVIFGTAPALMTSRANPIEALRGANRAIGGGSSWIQKSLVIGQAAMSLALLSTAALLGQSLRNLQHQDFGFATDGRYLVSINPQLSGYKAEQMDALYKRIDERLRQIPGVRMTAPVLYAPMSGDSWNEGLHVQGRPEPGPRDDTSASWARITPGFFETLGMTIKLGRPITVDDTATTRRVAVVNEAFVRKFFKGQNPIGQHFGKHDIKYAGSFEIVGVSNDVRYMPYGYSEPIGAMYWVPETQPMQYEDAPANEGEKASQFLSNIVIWAPGNPPGMEEKVRKALASVDANLVFYGADPYSEVVSRDFRQENMIATLTTLFGALGLVLAGVGLYGVLAYTVEQRTSEIGLRIALGANRLDMIRMVMRGAVMQMAIGLAIGVPLAVAAGRLMSDQLFHVKPWDPVMLAIAAAALALAALVASIVPASRAAGVEPMIALRNE